MLHTLPNQNVHKHSLPHLMKPRREERLVSWTFQLPGFVPVTEIMTQSRMETVGGHSKAETPHFARDRDRPASFCSKLDLSTDLKATYS